MNKHEVINGGLSGEELTAIDTPPGVSCPLYPAEVLQYQPELQEYIRRVRGEHPEASADIALLARALGVDIQLEFSGVSYYMWSPNYRIITLDATMTVPEMVHAIAGLLAFHFMSYAECPVYDVSYGNVYAASYQPDNGFLRMFGDLMLAA